MPVYTVKFPLDIVGKRDTFDVYDENNIEEVVKFNIKSTILTCPGERRGDPDFGTCAKAYLFNNEMVGFEDLRANILKQVQKYVPYCAILELVVETPENIPNGLRIMMRYLIPNINKKDIIELILSA